MAQTNEPLGMPEALAGLLDELAPVREMLLGYRAQLEEDGHHSAVVDQLMVQLHAYVVGAMFGRGGR